MIWHLQMKNRNPFGRLASLLAIMSQMVHAVPENPEQAFSGLVDFKVDNEFRAVLAAMPVQVDAGGARVIKMKDGSIWLVGIGSTIVNPASGAEIMRRNTIARAKAQASVVAEVNGSRVKAVSVMTTSDKISVTNGRESGKSEETLDEKIVTEAKGVINGMPVVGSWMNQDKTLYFVVIGRKLK